MNRRETTPVLVHDFEIVSLLTELENETFFAEALLFPEICRYDDSPEKALRNLRNTLPDFLDTLSTEELHSRRAPLTYEKRAVQVPLPPPRRNPYWTEPVTLEFQVLYWLQPGTHHAYVPALAIETISDCEESLFELLPRNIISSLQRMGVATSLGSLLWFQREREMITQNSKVELMVPSPKKRLESQTSNSKEPSILKDVATNLNVLGLPRAYQVEEQVKELAEHLVGNSGRSVLLVGESGVGKTALAYELVSRRRFHHLASTQFWETTGAQLMVGADCFGDWQDRCRKLVAEASSSRSIILFGNLFELAEVARHSTTPQGMAGYFRPYMERGDLLAIVECTPQQRELLERDHPHLVQTFAILEVKKPAAEQVLAILRDVTKKDDIAPEALEMVERLHRRYASYSAYPGRPLRFLKELLADIQGELTASQVARAFAQETGLPAFMVDDHLPLELEKTRAYFKQRILGQADAVNLVVDLLASVKAALSPPGRPIASLLFIGPTGVGKTEMARTLCGYLFQDRRRMVRFDMSEYADPLAVERLVGGQEGGHGLLTGKVREQPFGLVLFDELEKADPSFFDLLLQILGEGRLTDEAGRVADFTNSVIVMTSNLGAASFSKGPLGFRTTETTDQARQAFTSAVKAAFRPELFNRIDRLIPFAPLTIDDAKQVAQRELVRMQDRQGLASENVILDLGDGVAEHLAKLGYDRRYGARPLKRAIEKNLLEPLACLLADAGPEGLEVQVQLKGGELVWSHRRPDQIKKAGRRTSSSVARNALNARRQSQSIFSSRTAHGLRDRILRLKRLQRRKERNGHLSNELDAQLATLSDRENLLKRMDRIHQKSFELETDAVLAYQGHIASDPDLAKKVELHKQKLERLILSLYSSQFDAPNRATVLLFREKATNLKPLARGYREFWENQGIDCQSYALTLGARETKENKDDDVLRLGYGEELEDRALWCRPVSFNDSYSAKSIGAAYELTGELALPLMLGETGLHLFGPSSSEKIEVQVVASALKDYSPPLELHLRHNLTGQKRRLYSQSRGLVEDPRLDLYKSWTGKELGPILEQMITADLLRVAREACS